MEPQRISEPEKIPVIFRFNIIYSSKSDHNYESQLDPNSFIAHRLNLFRRGPISIIKAAVLHRTDRNYQYNYKPSKSAPYSYLSSILGELKVNLWDHIGIIVPQKG